MDRIDCTFPSGDDTCAAWLYRGATASPAPVVVMAHGLSGTRRDRLGAFAERFAAAGYAALVFDHRGFGDSTGEPGRFDPRAQLDDWRAAIAFARGLDGVDPAQVVTFGSSMGGGNALAAAADDPRVAAAISQVPFLDIVRQAHRSSPRVTGRMLLAALRDEHLPAVGQPDEPAFINAPNSEAGWRHVVAIGEDSRWQNRASAAGCSAVRIARCGRPGGCTARGWCASAPRTASRGRARRSRPAAAPRAGRCASTRAWITSTSTTGRNTRPSWRISSRSCDGT